MTKDYIIDLQNSNNYTSYQVFIRAKSISQISNFEILINDEVQIQFEDVIISIVSDSK